MTAINATDYFNRVRKSWIDKMPADVKAELKAIPSHTRFALYEKIDDAVVEQWHVVMNHDRDIDSDYALTLAAETTMLEIEKIVKNEKM